MNIFESDFRASMTLFTLEALDYGLQRLPTVETDGCIMMDFAEELIGLGFVALQTYVAGSIVDLKTVFPAAYSYSTDKFLQESKPVSCGVSSIDVIWAAANYYKHRDDWKRDWWREEWRRDPQTKKTILLLERLNVTERTDQPCVQLLEVLQAGNMRLASLMDIASDWRESWFAALHKATDQSAPEPSKGILATSGSKT